MELLQLINRFDVRDTTRYVYKRALDGMLHEGITLNDIIYNHECVTRYLSSISMHEFSNAYSSTIACVKVMNITDEKRNDLLEAYRSYFKTRSVELKELRNEYQRDESRNMGYGYVSFRDKVRDCILQERNPEHRLLMSLFVNNVPRRTSDYLCMYVNIEDDDIHNILIWTRSKKAFIFNDWKMVKSVGKQIVEITNEYLIRDVDTYMSEFPYHGIIFNHKPSWISSALKLIRKKYDIPFSVYDIRHMFSTYINDKYLSGEHKIQIASEMGTSVKYLCTAYDDHKTNRIVPHYSMNIDDIMKYI